jgi:hypothetical protein
MEFFDGVSLAAHLKAHGPLAVEDFVAVAGRVAKAMAAAHAAGVLHRDLKPGNVLVRRVGDGWDVRVIDFGLAVRFAAAQASVSTSVPHRTRRDQSFAGTLEYASPEQKGLIGVEVGPRSDVYGFGKTMLDALLGTTEPVTADWERVDEDERDWIKGVLEACVIRDPEHRLSGFEPLVQVLVPNSSFWKNLEVRSELTLLDPRTMAPVKVTDPEQEVPKLQDKWALEQFSRNLDRSRADVQRIRASVSAPGSQLMWEADAVVRNIDSWISNTDSAVRDQHRDAIAVLQTEAAGVAEAAKVATYEHAIRKALTQTLHTASSVRSIIGAIDQAVDALRGCGKLTDQVAGLARQGKERAARFRYQKKSDEAKVAEAGGSKSKAQRLRREALELLAQDWAQAFPGEQPPAPNP